ncbi:MAG: hypothetical protein UW94_C0003G0135 [Parcubacteria group bacterium GW2011_GWA2_45_14]|nr:MAG: hypothetical protein UW94_C0003G0135 [Parcubacteria group bacterium GW2011_GWA2_45_14]
MSFTYNKIMKRLKFDEIKSGMMAVGFASTFKAGTNLIFGWGWLVVVYLMLWVIWKVYLYIKMVDYVSAISWTFLQVTIPEDSEQTPKAMENIFAVLDGIHKNPDLVERYFEGYLEAWYSCELVCSKGRAKYVLVVPTVHKTFFEGVVYGQYPEAEVVETQDYTQVYDYKEIDKTFDLYGSEIVLTEDDIYPVKTYHNYEDVFAEEEKFIDPHQALVEAYTNVNENEQFWIQILIRPIDGKDIRKWADKGGEQIDKLAGKETKKSRGIFSKFIEVISQLPADAIKASVNGPLEAGKAVTRSSLDFPKISAGDTAKMDGILRKISMGGYRVKIRVLYVAPLGQLTKPNISRAIGGFKQFNTYNLNSFKPDPTTKTNGPNYVMKQTRRYRRKREIFLAYQWRDFWGYDEGYMMSDEELATLYHFPTKYSKAPAFERAKAGVGGAPENVPYV